MKTLIYTVRAGEQKPIDFAALKRFKQRPLSWWIAPLCRECLNCNRCAAQELACGEFADYASGTNRLRRFGREPTKEWFKFVFLDTDDKKTELAALRAAKASTPIVERAAA